MIVLPNDFPVLERKAVRIVVLDEVGNVLLLRTRDVSDPGLGAWWELPGGGIDDGETYLQAALRELHEEVGIVVNGAQVGEPNWRRSASFRYRRQRRLQDEVVIKVVLPVRSSELSGTARLNYEIEDHIDYRWWPITEIENSQERFYPGTLPVLLAPFLAGHEIDEPFELWS